MKTTKKIFAVLMSLLVVLIYSIPMTAFADIEGQQSDNGSVVSEPVDVADEGKDDTAIDNDAAEPEPVVDNEEADADTDEDANTEDVSSDDVNDSDAADSDFNYSGSLDGISVEISAASGVLPEGTTVSLAPLNKSQLDAVNSNDVDNIIGLDITFKDAEGNIIEPNGNVNVKYTSSELEGVDKADMSLVHINDEGEILDENVDANLDGSELSFDVSAFTAYVIVVSKKGKTISTTTGETIQFTGKDSHYHDWSIVSGDSFVTLSSDGNTATVTANSPGTAYIQHTYCSRVFPKHIICYYRTEIFKVYISGGENSDTVKVPVYATSGKAEGRDSELERILGLNYKQDDGYYPVGVVELPKSLFFNNDGSKKSSPYIKETSDWEAVSAAIEQINKDYLVDTDEDNGTANKGNTVGDKLAYVMPDLGYGSGSQRTALFDWGGSSRSMKDNPDERDGCYDYHLDLRFATNKVTYIAVGDYTETLGEVNYLTKTSITAPKGADIAIPEGYVVEGYYADSDCKTSYTFGNAINEDQIVYVKLEKSSNKENVYVYLKVVDEDGNQYAINDGKISVQMSGSTLDFTVNDDSWNSGGTKSGRWCTIGKTQLPLDKASKVQILDDGKYNIVDPELSNLLTGFDFTKVTPHTDNSAFCNANLWNAVEWIGLKRSYGAIGYPSAEEAAWHLDGTLTIDSLAYDANAAGLENSIPATPGLSGASVKVTSSVYTREGYTFAGWNTKADGTGTDYDAEDDYTLVKGEADILYAQWIPDVAIRIDYVDDEGNELKDSTYVTDIGYGSYYNVDNDTYIPASIVKDGVSYVKDSVEGETYGTLTKDVVITVRYSEDRIGTNGGPDGIADKYQITVTYKVVNGKWDNEDSNEDKTVVLTLSDGKATYTAPAVGSNPDTGYQAGSWDTDPPAEYTTSGTYTYRYAPKEYTVTVNYLDDSTPANQIQTSFIDSKKYNIGDPYTVASEKIPSSITKGSDNYILETTEGDLSGTIGNSDVVINAYYTLDNIGSEGKSDGIADKYQITVTYKVEHGMWDDGTTADKKVVLTLLDGTVTCIVPAVGNKPDYGYEAGRWDSAPPTEYTESGTYTYTYVYEPKEVVDPIIPPFTPESVYTVTYMDGVDDEVVFEDQSTTNLKAGAKTPAFNGEPVRAGYKFIGWSPEVAETVTGDAVYYAQWEKLPEEPAVVDPSGDNDPIDDGKDIDAQPNGDADTDVEAKGVKTGDETMLAMWGALGLIAALGLGGTLVIGRRREE